MRKSLLRHIGLLVLSLFLANMSFAQSTITGKVTEAKNGDPIVGASVAIEGSTEGVLTDLNGNYKLQTKKSPPFKIIVNFVGFNAQTFGVSSASATLTPQW